jgi:hypothetical protein
MSFPKNKRREIVVGGVKYEWCFSKGTLYYKRLNDKKLIAIAVPYTDKIQPKNVVDYILNKKGDVATPALIASAKKMYDEAKIKDRSTFKLYVWQGVLQNWTSGSMIAYARSLKEARDTIKNDLGYDSETVRKDLLKEPDLIIHGKPSGFCFWGSD